MPNKVEILHNKIPNHIAIIMDGNRRWAHEQGLPIRKGHEEGVEALKRVIDASLKLNLNVLTVFGFSLENWNRSEAEIGDLFWVMRKYLKKQSDNFLEKGVSVNIIGSLEKFDDDLVKALRDIEEKTKHCDQLILNVALGYGAKQDILQAVNQLVKDKEIDEVSEALFASKLWSSSLPEVDLLIRTSGEYRISNFLLWQIAYAEMYYTEMYWPDFCGDALQKAIKAFNQRNRRFGSDAAPDSLDSISEKLRVNG